MYVCGVRDDGECGANFRDGSIVILTVLFLYFRIRVWSCCCLDEWLLRKYLILEFYLYTGN